MKKKYLFLIPIIVLIIIIFIIINNPKDEEYYILKDDKIKSITNLLGERKLTRKTKKNYNDTIIKTYKYKKVKNPSIDLSKYIIYLENESNFMTTKKYNLNKEKGTLQLSRYSTEKNYIILIDISYNKNSYTIKITRGKGKITPLNNS